MLRLGFTMTQRLWLNTMVYLRYISSMYFQNKSQMHFVKFVKQSWSNLSLMKPLADKTHSVEHETLNPRGPSIFNQHKFLCNIQYSKSFFFIFFFLPYPYPRGLQQNKHRGWESNPCPSANTGSQVQLTTPRLLRLT